MTDVARVRAALNMALPKNEAAAVQAWLSTFFPFQQEWLLDQSRFALILKSRQIGASHTFAASMVLWALFGETTTVISIGEREAIEVLEKADRHARALEKLGSRWAVGKPTSTERSFASGGRVVALPASSGGRSYSGNVVLDEFAYHQRPEAVWDGAAAVVLHGYRMRVLSTPNGVGNLFHTLWTDPKANKGYTKHAVTIEQARADGMRVDEAECWRMARGDPRVYAQLFQCSFLASEEQYLPTDMVLRAVTESTSIEYGEYYVGVDVGLTHDLTTIVVIRQAPTNVCYVQEIIRCKRTEWEQQMAHIEATKVKYDWKRLCIDATGIGAVPAQLLQKKFGRMKVEPVTFTNNSKEELATTLYQAFADDMIRMQRDPKLIDDLCALRRIITTAGNVRYDAPRTQDGHADSAWGLALALHGCAKPSKVVAHGPSLLGSN